MTFASVVYGDNVAVMNGMPDGSVDLAYLDPPWFTGQAFSTADGRLAYDDRWPCRAAYLDALRRRLGAVRRLLAPHGTIVVHVEPRIGHLVRLELDAAFGAEQFMAEVVWRYRRWPTKTPNFQAMHDVLYVYRRDARVPGRWNQLHEPLAPSTLKAWGTKKQRAVVVGGKRKRSSSTEAESDGAPLSDVWELGIIAPVAKERVGYPTQKPEKLLERVIGALSNPGDVVLDPYMGSGTTLAVAARMGRSAIGIDRSEVAIEVASKRLGAAPICPGLAASLGAE